MEDCMSKKSSDSTVDKVKKQESNYDGIVLYTYSRDYKRSYSL